MLILKRLWPYSSMLIATALLLAPANSSLAFDVFWTNTGTGSWTNPNNWDILGVPIGSLEDVPVVNNGGTVTLNTAAADGAAGLALGYAADSSGTLVIQSGGSLTLIETAGAAVDVAPNGAANVGFEGGTGNEGDTGLLEIQGGGTFEAVYFDINQNGTLLIGTGTGVATASTTTGSLFSNGTVEIVGPGHNVSLAGNFVLEEKAEGSSRFVPHITGANHTVINVTGNAQLGGSLVPKFDGVVPQLGDSWDLVDATEVTGDLDIDGSQAPALSPGLAYTTRVVSGGNGEILQMEVAAFATLKVNTTTGAVSMVSESGDPINMVGYTIGSASGRLNEGSWNSLTNQGQTGWQEAGGSATAVSELNPENSLSMSTTAINLGNSLYAPPAEFGEAPDITFQYGVDGETTPTNGIIEYTGNAAINNLLLTVDPATGEGQLKNSSPFSIDIVGYSIRSAAGSLDAANWTSLESQTVAGWDDAASDEFGLNELVPLDPASALSPGQAYSLGEMFQTGGAEDLTLQFALVVDGVPEIRQGVVVYDGIGGIPGDLNGDGFVGASDLGLVLNNWGAPDTPVPDGWIGDPQPTAPNIGSDDLGAVLTAWGDGSAPAALASASVPEPSTVVIVLAALCVLGGVLQRRRSMYN